MMRLLLGFHATFNTRPSCALHWKKKCLCLNKNYIPFTQNSNQNACWLSNKLMKMTTVLMKKLFVIIKFLHLSPHSKLPSTRLCPEPVQCTFTSLEPIFLISHFNVNLKLSDVVFCHEDLETRLWIHLLVSLMYATHPAHLILLYLITLQNTSLGIISSLFPLC